MFSLQTTIFLCLFQILYMHCMYVIVLRIFSRLILIIPSFCLFKHFNKALDGSRDPQCEARFIFAVVA